MGALDRTPSRTSVAAWRRQPRDAKGEPGPLPGLANLGNTCFANSVLQCLLNTPSKFLDACLAFGRSGSSRKVALGNSFQNLVREYSSASGGALQRTNPALRSVKDAVAAINPQYAGCKQQDAYEFLGCVLEGLEQGFSALSRADSPASPGPGSDIIQAIFGVTTHTRRECHSCRGCFEVDRVTDTALRLPLLSPEAQLDPRLREREERTPVTLQQLMDAARKPEVIEGYDCDACRKRSTERGRPHVRSKITQHASVISTTGDVLVVVLYRFAHALDAAGNFRPMKVRRKVACPPELALGSGSYRLFAMISHLGTTLSAGHYVAAVRSRRNGAWYECNDETVTPLSSRALCDGQAVTSVRDGAEPYILFYQRRPAPSASLGRPVQAVKPKPVGAPSPRETGAAPRVGRSAPQKEAAEEREEDEERVRAQEGRANLPERSPFTSDVLLPERFCCGTLGYDGTPSHEHLSEESAGSSSTSAGPRLGSSSSSTTDDEESPAQADDDEAYRNVRRRMADEDAQPSTPSGRVRTPAVASRAAAMSKVVTSPLLSRLRRGRDMIKEWSPTTARGASAQDLGRPPVFVDGRREASW